MTTIVYDHENKQIACDSRLLKGFEIRSDKYQKWRRIDNGIAFFSGTVADINSFIGMMGEDFKQFPIKTNTMCLLVRDGKVFECCFDDEDGYFEIEISFNAAIGSGGLLALSALDFELSAYDAVEYAKERDAGTGGKVYVYDIGNDCFL